MVVGFPMKLTPPSNSRWTTQQKKKNEFFYGGGVAKGGAWSSVYFCAEIRYFYLVANAYNHCFKTFIIWLPLLDRNLTYWTTIVIHQEVILPTTLVHVSTTVFSSHVNWQQKFNPYLATLLAHRYNISIFTMIRPHSIPVTIDNINRYLCCNEERQTTQLGSTGRPFSSSSKLKYFHTGPLSF